MRWVYILLPIIFLLPVSTLVVSCTLATKYAVVPVEEEEQFNICKPLRGEGIPFDTRRHGQAFNAPQHFCI